MSADAVQVGDSACHLGGLSGMAQPSELGCPSNSDKCFPVALNIIAGTQIGSLRTSVRLVKGQGRSIYGPNYV